MAKKPKDDKREAEEALARMMREDAKSVEPTADQIEQIKTAAREMYARAATGVTLEAELAEVKAEVKRLSEQVLPLLMDQAAITSLKLTDNLMLERSEAVFASVSKVNAMQAADWLEENGHGAIIKYAITIPLEKGDTKLEKFVKATLKKAKIGFEESCSVHPQTLNAFARESIEAGRTLPKEIAVLVQPIVKLKMAKAKGAK